MRLHPRPPSSQPFFLSQTHVSPNGATGEYCLRKKVARLGVGDLKCNSKLRYIWCLDAICSVAMAFVQASGTMDI